MIHSRFVTGFILAGAGALASLSWAEGTAICEVTPKAQCLERSQIEDKVFALPVDAMGLSRHALSLCDSSYLYTTAPDVILILDNTGSMAKVRSVNGVPRYCDLPVDPNAYPEDPGCVSGDPDTLRAEALRAFVDSALVKGGAGTRVAVILFSDRVLNSDEIEWTELGLGTVDVIKQRIVAEAEGSTNYYAAFKAAVDLLQTSSKPKEEQTIIFVSDGRPNRPLSYDGGPYLYKQYLENGTLPAVHSIFLGDQSINYQDLKDISNQTGGLFFPIRDVSKMASILTDSISKQLFRRALPTTSTVTNLTNKASFTVSASGHVPNADTSAYTLQLPGPLALDKDINRILVRTRYGNGAATVDLNFSLQRGGGEEVDTNLFAFTCRPRAEIALLNDEGENLSGAGGAYRLSDSAAFVRLMTGADLDSFPIVLRLEEKSTARSDAETLVLPAGSSGDSMHTGSLGFSHQAAEKNSGNQALDAVHGDRVLAVWRNPWLPEDSASAFAVVRYGPDVLSAAVFDEDDDGRAETARILLGEELPRLPARIRLRLKGGDGDQVDRIATAADHEIEFAAENGKESKNALVIRLKTAFPREATTTDPAEEAGHFFRQDDIPLVDADFTVDDSLPPGIFKAEIKESDRAHELRRITVTFTEPVVLADKALEPFRVNRGGTLVDGADMPIDKIEKLSTTTWDVYLQAGAAFQPVGGDSLAIALGGDLRDEKGRAPSALLFTEMSGRIPGQNVKAVSVTFGNGNKSYPDGDNGYSRPEAPAFIPVDSTGAALPGSSNGKCGNCSGGRDGHFNGSVIHMTVPGPVRYELVIFSNLGVFVNRFSGEVEAKDLPYLSQRNEGEGDEKQRFYTQRIVWNGLTAGKQLANTGAYVLKAVFHFDPNRETGAKASQETQVRRFGFLRNCCATTWHWAEIDY